jgi:hypothetical protein
MIPSEDEAKELIARGLWKNLLMMLIEEVIELIQLRDEKFQFNAATIDALREQIDKLRKYLKALQMYETFLTTKGTIGIFKREQIYETLYNEAEEEGAPERT